MSKKKDPLGIAVWRFGQISPLLDPKLTPGERSRMIDEISRVPVRWPSGAEEPIARATLYRWLRLYRQTGELESLMPKPRSCEPCGNPAILPEWVDYALALLEQEPRRSLFILADRLKREFQPHKEISTSSLHRALRREPRYRNLMRRARGEKKQRRRFQATRPHEIWHADAKGAFTVQFTDGTKHSVRILSILDDRTRYVLSALAGPAESVTEVVRVMRRAVARFGAPDKFYADRGSAYDSTLFRTGLALLGIHRIRTKPRNAAAHGKIEAYHRILERWFIIELKHQKVLDWKHLQDLLDAVIEELYHNHRHRELKMTPREALGGSISKRIVSLERLRDAFLQEKRLKAHPKTGEIRVHGILFRVPREHIGPSRKVRIAIDPEDPKGVFLKRKDRKLVPLKPAIEPADFSPSKEPRSEPVGSLTPLLDAYRGRSLPQARSGFGLPEIYKALSHALGRAIPATEIEATMVTDWLRARGPFDPRAFHGALSKVIARLGSGRALAQILKALDHMIREGGKNP